MKFLTWKGHDLPINSAGVLPRAAGPGIFRLTKNSLVGLCIVFAWLFSPSTLCFSHSIEPQVLILNSYHQGYVWSDQEMSGLLSRLRAVYPQIDPFIDYLDAKRSSGERHAAVTRDYLLGKYKGRKIDLVVVLDNPAYELILQHRDELFPGVPVVFAGVNDFEPTRLHGIDGVTGVAELMDISGTLKIAMTLHSGIRKIFVVHDYTSSGMAVRKEMEACLAEFEQDLEFEFVPPVTFEELLARMNSLLPDSLGIILTFTTDKSGRSYPLAQSTQLITSAAVPVFATHQTRLGHGIIGGSLLSGEEHGQRAGDIAVRILRGESPDMIPVDLTGTSSAMFDYQQLARFGISIGDLPRDSLIVNLPESLFHRHKYLVLGTLGVIAVLSLVIIILSVTICRRRISENALRISETRYRRLHESIMDAFVSVDMDGRIKECNEAFRRMLGYDSEEIALLTYKDLTPEKWHLFENEVIKPQVLSKGYSDIYEKEYRRKDGMLLPVELRAFLLRSDQGIPPCIGAIVRDITERAIQTREIRLLNRLYSVLSLVSRAVVRATSPEAFLDQACRVIVEGGGFLLCWIGRVEPATSAVEPVALSGEIGEYVRGLPVFADDRPEGRGPTGGCISQRRPVVFNDFLHDPLSLPWHERAAPFGIAAAAAFPIIRAGRLWGALTIYSDEIDRFGREDIELLEQVAGDIGFALDNLDGEFLRKQAEAALVESEQRFKLLYEHAPLAYQSLDERGNFVEVNQAWLDALGCTRQDVIGRNFADFLAPGWADHFKKNFPRFMAVGEVLGVEFEMVKKDGSTMLVSFHGKIGRDPHGRFEQTHCIFHNITEQRRAEEMLQESERRFRSLFENSPVAYQAFDSEGRYIDVNQGLCELLGYSPEELIGRSFCDFWPENEREAFSQFVESFKLDCQVNSELLLVTKDGREVSVILAGRVEHGSVGCLMRTHCILTDITRRKQAEDQANTEKETLSRIFESAPYIMMLVNNEGRVANINRRGIAFAGRPKEELLGLLGGEVFNCLNSLDGPGVEKVRNATTAPCEP